MIMFEFSNNVSVTLRTSGTEPKIKFYTELRHTGVTGTAEAAKETLVRFVNDLVVEMLQPEANGLEIP